MGRPTSDRATPGCGHRKSDGFTLLELMVVVTIITILVAVGTTASLRALGAAAEQSTRLLLANAKGVAEAYESATGVSINHEGTTPIDWSTNKPYNEIQPWTTDPPGGDPATPDWEYYVALDPDNNSPKIEKKIEQNPSLTNDADEDYFIERFVWAAMQQPTTKKMLMALGRDLFIDDHDGRTQKNGFMELRDGWGTRLRYYQFNDGSDGGDPTIPDYLFPFFASAGPDGKWGDANGADGTPAKMQAADNLYSFELEKDRR